jgi:hypothetical protein
MENVNTKYFSHKELACKKTGCVVLSPSRHIKHGDGEIFYIGFGQRMDELRERWGKPLVVNSVCRSREHNKEVGGNRNSLHVYDYPFWPTGGTIAADFRETSKEFRELAYEMGFSLGLAKTFTHCDDRFAVLGLPQTTFTY